MDDILVVLDPQKYVELLETLKEGMPATFYMTYIVTNIIDWNNLKEKKGLDWYKNVSELVPRSASILVPRTGFQNATFFVVDEYKVT